MVLLSTVTSLTANAAVVNRNIKQAARQIVDARRFIWPESTRPVEA
jgi:hypothetical protein